MSKPIEDVINGDELDACPECGFVLDQDEQEADILVCHKCGLGWDKDND